MHRVRKEPANEAAHTMVIKAYDETGYNDYEPYIRRCFGKTVAEIGQNIIEMLQHGYASFTVVVVFVAIIACIVLYIKGLGWSQKQGWF